MFVELSLKEIELLRNCLVNGAPRVQLLPEAFGLGAKLENIIISIKNIEGKKYIK